MLWKAVGSIKCDGIWGRSLGLPVIKGFPSSLCCALGGDGVRGPDVDPAGGDALSDLQLHTLPLSSPAGLSADCLGAV